MGVKDDASLTGSDKKLVIGLLRLEKASAYALAKQTEMSYASMFMSIKKLESIKLVEKLGEVRSKKGGRKVIYRLTKSGQDVGRRMVDALWGIGGESRRIAVEATPDRRLTKEKDHDE